MADALDALFEDKKQDGNAPAATATPPTPDQVTPEPAPAAQPEPPKPPTAEPGHIPIAALLDEREKRKKLEAELNELRSKQQPSEQVPSIQEDPEAWAAQVQDRMARAELAQRFSFSERFALKEFSADEVSAAKEWAEQRGKTESERFGFSPFAAEFVRQDDPISWVVRQHRQDKLLGEIGSDEAARKTWVEAEAKRLGLIPSEPPQSASAPAAPQPAASQPQAPKPTKSLAAAPNAGGGTASIPTGPGAAFDAVIR